MNNALSVETTDQNVHADRENLNPFCNVVEPQGKWSVVSAVAIYIDSTGICLCYSKLHNFLSLNT